MLKPWARKMRLRLARGFTRIEMRTGDVTVVSIAGLAVACGLLFDPPMSVAQAREFAVRAHGEQKYGQHPYSVHLDAVAAIAAPFGELAQVIAYLHDVVEDTEVSLDEVRATFGELVGECVGLLTDAPGANRKERKSKTYARLAGVAGPAELALVVKAADRLANVRACVRDGDAGLWRMYRSEQAAFRGAAFRAGQCDALWDELERLLAPVTLPTL
jgi:(p)ppGpp synthase/HD superfamily hydrolase